MTWLGMVQILRRGGGWVPSKACGPGLAVMFAPGDRRLYMANRPESGRPARAMRRIIYGNRSADLDQSMPWGFLGAGLRWARPSGGGSPPVEWLDGGYTMPRSQAMSRLAGGDPLAGVVRGRVAYDSDCTPGPASRSGCQDRKRPNVRLLEGFNVYYSRAPAAPVAGRTGNRTSGGSP